MSILHTFPLSVFNAATGAILHETENFMGYLPHPKEAFTVGNSIRYKCQTREFFYNADMHIIAVELWVKVLG